ncbi:MAG TPA: HAD family hydrolase [Candidatus Eremiobacteraceae bacterium]|nr:HAD family hydrolase [Candidatus Eremiobacteraceae bacterium]
MLHAIFFDLDDTLVDDTVSLEQCAVIAARELTDGRGASPEALGTAYVDAAIEFWTSLEPRAPKPATGAIRRGMWAKALTRYGIDDESLATKLARRFDELRVQRVELFPEAVPVLTALHQRYRMAIITNGYAETHDKKIARLELGRFFDHIVLAGDLEMVKPNPDIFRHAMKLLDARPEESLMVGDRYDRDIIGAHEAGMRAVWIRCRDEMVPEGARAPDATITSIAELPAVLANLK